MVRPFSPAPSAGSASSTGDADLGVLTRPGRVTCGIVDSTAPGDLPKDRGEGVWARAATTSPRTRGST
ncbi:hypothetical protein FM114_08335 [Luteococcus japonicus LSP_Lj1]|uniref:Uncharacterized protein n=1 Tax=Luteococcus japonicus LSP_Lj1 TaxID=1255658 RepID=A0A1R4JMB6_9ACTN|nr:hypothetical protein FM114_08335 [Luteococcus japonicus LSP_Lj1]